MPPRTLIDGLKNHAELSVNGLRDYEEPPDIKVYDLQGNLKRIDNPPTPDDLRASIKHSIEERINGKKREK